MDGCTDPLQNSLPAGEVPEAVDPRPMGKASGGDRQPDPDRFPICCTATRSCPSDVSWVRRAIMCPGCSAMHYGPGAFCTDRCRDEAALRLRAIISGEYRLVPDPGAMILRGIVFKSVMEDLAKIVAKQVFERLLPRVARRPRSNRYWRKRARRERLGYGSVP